jgi:hypothetical protein
MGSYGIITTMEHKGLNTTMRYYEITSDEIVEAVNPTSPGLNRAQKSLMKKSDALFRYESKLRAIGDSRAIATRSGNPSKRAERVAKATAKRADASRIYGDAVRAANASIRPKPTGAG